MPHSTTRGRNALIDVGMGAPALSGVEEGGEAVQGADGGVGIEVHNGGVGQGRQGLVARRDEQQRTGGEQTREVGQVVTEIGLAATAPAEFIVVRIIHRAGTTDSV